MNVMKHRAFFEQTIISVLKHRAFSEQTITSVLRIILRSFNRHPVKRTMVTDRKPPPDPAKFSQEMQRPHNCGEDSKA